MRDFVRLTLNIPRPIHTRLQRSAELAMRPPHLHACWVLDQALEPADSPNGDNSNPQGTPHCTSPELETAHG